MSKAYLLQVLLVQLCQDQRSPSAVNVVVFCLVFVVAVFFLTASIYMDIYFYIYVYRYDFCIQIIKYIYMYI